MLCLIGCGNLARSDDGVGVVIARRLLGMPTVRQRADVRVFDAGTAGMQVMFNARGAKKLIIIDACASGAEPGAIFRVPGNELKRDYYPSYTLHDFRWDHALAAGQRIFSDDFPADVDVYLIEAAQLGYGLELSTAVTRAADRLTEDLYRLITSYCANNPS